MKYLSVLTCILLLFVSSCNEVNPKGEKDLRDFVTQWNNLHTQLKAPYLESLYMPTVTYFGKARTRVQVQADKNRLFQEFPNYTQEILNNNITIAKKGANYLVTFVMRVSYNNIEENYPFFISAMLRNGEFKILREGLAEDAVNTNAPIFPNSEISREIISKNRKVYGDFDGDGLSDYATVIGPEIIENDINSTSQQPNCNGPCNSIISFSSSKLTNIVVLNSYQSDLENLKDLNSDGADELGYWDIKPNTKTLYIYNAVTGTLLAEPVVINTAVHKNLKLIDVFKKTGPNKITTTQSAFENGKWMLKTTTVYLD
ncbi:hypothetical protein ACFSQP_03410 [Bizionia sediminis]|uniref:DUF4440 domain-containing protein n=1 Tax=Bizionia sediminis TaxID=1737064 RepID=A0ABW5KRG9_9FLAO